MGLLSGEVGYGISHGSPSRRGGGIEDTMGLPAGGGGAIKDIMGLLAGGGGAIEDTMVSWQGRWGHRRYHRSLSRGGGVKEDAMGLQAEELRL